MSLSRRQTYALICVGLVLGLGIVAASHWNDAGEVSGSGYVAPSGSGPQIALPSSATEWNSDVARQSDTELRLETHGGGNGTFISNGYTKADVQSMQGTWINMTGMDVSSNELYINPDTAPAANVSGATDELSYRSSIQLDDGTADFYYRGSSGQTQLTLRGLPASTGIAAIDDNDDVLDVASSDGNGALSLTLDNSGHNVSLQSTSGTVAPGQANAAPTETVRTEDQTLSVDISDGDFPQDNVSVTIDLDGSQVHTEDIKSNSTVSTSVTSLSEGSHTWTVNATDAFGNTNEQQYSFEVAHYEPELGVDAQTNQPLEPSGNLDIEPSNIEYGFRDRDIQLDGDTVDVVTELDGSQIDSTTYDSNNVVTGENFTNVSLSMPQAGQTGGEHTINVTATDDYGNTVTKSTTYSVPDTLYIRNETGSNELIDSPINVTVQFFYEEDEVIERTVDDGTVDLTNLPVNEEFRVDVDATSNYYSRTIEINSIYEQQTAYLLNKTFTTVESRFVLEDPTGSFGPETTLKISKPIQNGTSGSIKYRIVEADIFGAEGVVATLEKGKRYRLSIESDDGVTQDLGDYRAEVSETVELRPEANPVVLAEFNQTWNYGASLDNRSLTWYYYDTEDKTDELTIWIHEQGNTSNQLRANVTYTNLGNASGQYQLTANESRKNWVVNFVVNRDGNEVVREEIVGDVKSTVPGGLDSGWQQMAGIAMLILFAGAFSILNRGAGAIMLAVGGGILFLSGWLTGATTGAAIVIFLFIAILYNLLLSRPG